MADFESKYTGEEVESQLDKMVGLTDENGYVYSAGEKVDMRFTRSLLPVGTSIPASANLNTIEFLKIGKYYCSQNVDAKTVKNCPVNMAFSMEVFNPLGTNIDDETTADYTYRLRVLTPYDTGIHYIQCCRTSGTPGTWTYDSWYVTPRSKFTLASSKNDGTAAIGSTNKGVYIDSNGEIKAMSYTVGKSVPTNAVFTDTDTKVTAVGNHYAPAEDEDQQIDAPSGEVVTGIKRDAAGHVVGVVSAPQTGGGGGGESLWHENSEGHAFCDRDIQVDGNVFANGTVVTGSIGVPVPEGGYRTGDRGQILVADGNGNVTWDDIQNTSDYYITEFTYYDFYNAASENDQLQISANDAVGLIDSIERGSRILIPYGDGIGGYAIMQGQIDSGEVFVAVYTPYEAITMQCMESDILQGNKLTFDNDVVISNAIAYEADTASRPNTLAVRDSSGAIETNGIIDDQGNWWVTPTSSEESRNAADAILQWEITDLEEIRKGASKGATAVQPSDLPTKVSQLENDSNFVDEQTLSKYVKKETFAGLDTAQASAISGGGMLYALPDQANGGEDDILLSRDSVKTINGESIYGAGNITFPNPYIARFTIEELRNLSQGELDQISICDKGGLKQALAEHRPIFILQGEEQQMIGYSVMSGYYEDLLYLQVISEVGELFMIETDITDDTPIYNYEVRCSILTDIDSSLYGSYARYIYDSTEVELQANTYSTLLSLVSDNLTISLSENYNTNYTAEYVIRFQVDPSSEGAELIVPENILWADGLLPAMTSGKTYEISFLRIIDSVNITATFLEF